MTNKAPLKHFWVRLLVTRHLQALTSSIGRLGRNPFATLMTTLVIAISLALPLSLFIIVQNAEHISQQWHKGRQLSVFLKLNTNAHQLDELMGHLRLNRQIATISYISPEQALEQFEQTTGVHDLLTTLPENPLPGVIVVKPTNSTGASLSALKLLASKIQRYPQVELVELDFQWVERLLNIIILLKKAILAFAALLGIGVILIIGNTIRLAIENCKEELEIIKLVGATNAFIRRPFLHTGILYGLLGGVFAWICVDAMVLWFQGTVNNLSKLYASNFQLNDLSLYSAITMAVIGASLGLLAAYTIVTRELHLID